jgi:ATP-binding cassette, subfamily B, bacterial
MITLLVRVVKFLFSISPLLTISIFCIQAFSGIFPILTLNAIQRLVDSISKSFNDSKIINTNISSISFWILIWLIATLAESVLPSLSTLIQGKLGESLSLKINLGLMRKANNFSDIRIYEDPQFYDQLNHLNEESSQQPILLINHMIFGGRLLFSSFAIVSLLFSLAWWIPFVVLAVIIPQSYIGTLIENRSWEMANSKNSKVREMSYVSSVLLSSIYVKEIRLFSLGEHFISRYISAFQSWHRTKNKIRSNEFYWSIVTSLAVTSVIAGIFTWLISRAFSGSMSLGSLFVFIQSISYLERSVSGLVSAPLMLYESLLYMKLYFSFIDQKDSRSNDTEGLILTPADPITIEFDNVSFVYPNGRQALSNISFTICPTQTVAIVGENGSGKTTLIKLLLKFYSPTSGCIYLNGINLQDLDTERLRTLISAVFQDFGQYSCSLSDNITMSDFAVEKFEMTDHPDQETRLHKTMEKAGVITFLDCLPDRERTLLGKEFGGSELSGGQWQKIAIARALYREGVQLLILDEPTAALDPRSEFELFSQFSQLAKGQTTLLITHRLASIQMADQILVLKQGSLVEQGTHTDLLQAQGEYENLWTMQASYYQNMDKESQ